MRKAFRATYLSTALFAHKSYPSGVLTTKKIKMLIATLQINRVFVELSFFSWAHFSPRIRFCARKPVNVF